ncbi:MAG: hypothetical protein L3J14_07255 [Flavobacteriaceae bacterium]|nr:hypothetical protein [Flavobacteriaceae bacterium]
MRIIFITLTFLCLYSCAQKNNNLFCKKKRDAKISDTIFKKSEIISLVTYDKNCKINSIEMLVILDERSKDLNSFEDLRDVTVKLGYIPDTTINIILKKKNYNLMSRKDNLILKVKHEFKEPYLDTLNFIDIQTISYSNLEKKIIKSNSYFYNDSKKILDIENTYLDYSSFKKTNTRFKNISESKNKLDSILVTTKTSKFIDNLTKYHIQINDTLLLNFRCSIKADYKKFQLQNKKVTIYDLLKINKNFITFKLKLNELNLTKIYSLKVSLN